MRSLPQPASLKTQLHEPARDRRACTSINLRDNAWCCNPRRFTTAQILQAFKFISFHGEFFSEFAELFFCDAQSSPAMP